MRSRFACLLFAAVLAPVTAEAQGLAFIRDDYAAPTGTRAALAGDFDRNGWPDLALAVTPARAVVVLLNTPGAGLPRRVQTAVGDGAFDLASADFNRDAILDLVVANADSHSISVLLGKGDGSFTRQDIPAPSQNPRGVAAGDIDGDNRADLIFTAYATGLVQVLFGNGQGGFATGPAWQGGAALRPQGVGIADFNRDGRADLAVAAAAGLWILHGNGGSAFAARAIGGGSSLNVLAIADLNRDGWEDVAAASTALNRVSVYKGGAPGLALASTHATGASPRGLQAADVNHDGALDLLTANRATSTVTVLRGDPARRGTFASETEVPGGRGSRALAAADFDRDGRIDLATGNEYERSATVLWNRTIFERSAYAFRRQRIFDGHPPPDSGEGAVWGGRVVAAADFNRDGRPDTAFVQPSLADYELTDLSVALHGGLHVRVPQVGFVHRMLVGDVNVDGNPDVIYVTSETRIRTNLGNGRGGFTPAGSTELWFPATGAMTLADVQGDGIPDLVLGASDSDGATLQVMIGTGDGTFTEGPGVLSPGYPLQVAVADINRDGAADLAVLTPEWPMNGGLTIWPGTGTGGFGTPETIAVAGMDVLDFKFGDVNRDGHLDAIVTDYWGLSIALGGAGGFSAAMAVPPSAVCGSSGCGGSASQFELADMNGDGNLDVVMAGGALVLGDGNGGFSFGGTFDQDAGAVAIADYNGDALPDLLFVTRDGELDVLLNERNATNLPPAVHAGPERTIDFQAQYVGDGLCFDVQAIGADPDSHALSFTWTDPGGAILSGSRTLPVCNAAPGTHTYFLRADDGRGGSVEDSVNVTLTDGREIVLYAGAASVEYDGSNWFRTQDWTAAGGWAAYNPNLGAPKAGVSQAFSNYVVLQFIPNPAETYKLWVRLKADNNSWANDSVWVQFSGATDVNGAYKYLWGSSSALAVNLEECSGCGISDWGWEDDGWGAVNRNGVLLRFPGPGVQMVVVQTREDGVAIDQIVLSAERYLTTRPGKAKNDTTILSPTYPR